MNAMVCAKSDFTNLFLRENEFEQFMRDLQIILELSVTQSI